MKKVLLIALAVALVVSVAATAMAADVNVISPNGSTIKMSGDARVRGLWRQNYDFEGESPSDDNRIWDSRVRLILDATTAGGVKVMARLRMDGGTWGYADNQENFYYTHNTSGTSASGTYSGIADGNEGNSYSVVADWFYMVVPIKKATMTIGRQTADWGNKLLIWDVRRDRLKVTYPFASNITGVALYDKLVDTRDDRTGSGGNLKDRDDYALGAIGTFGDWKVGTLWIYITDFRRQSDGATDGLADQDFSLNHNDSQRTLIGDIFWNGKAGQIAISGEASAKWNVGSKTDFGIFADATMPIGSKATIKVVAANAQGGYVADDDFIPLNLIGLDNPWAVMNFGGMPAGAVTAVDLNGDGDTTDNGVDAVRTRTVNGPNLGVHNEGKAQTLLGVSGAFKLNDMITLAADAGYIWDGMGNAKTASAAVVWQITPDTNWTFLTGVWQGEDEDNNWWTLRNTDAEAKIKSDDSGIYAKGDTYWVLGHKLETKF